MITEWKEHLENAGAEFSQAGVANYGNAPREISVALTGNVFADLSHYGVISVHGEDAETFLQGQLTNDLRLVDETHSQFSGYCTAKGRLLATFRVFLSGDSHYLVLPSSMIETVIKKLRMYVIAAKVTLEDASDTFVHLGLSGEEAGTALADVTGSTPGQLHEVVQDDKQVVIRVPGIFPSYEVFTRVDQARLLWDKLDVHCAPIGAESWRLLDIQAGIPMVYAQTSEAFIPQMVNLQLVDGVSFKKGCYTGQEIVARMQYLGKLKRRMYRGKTRSGEAPQPGEEIFPSDGNSQAVGKVVSAAAHPDGGFSLLVVLQISTAEADVKLQIGSADGPVLELLHLPYPFPTE